ncbi:MAG: type II toxin-antitoxin system Phd/YefM family antitoxin [Pyrinomonadaceae bacterium]
MTKVNIHEAKTNLSKLIEKAKNGEEVVIAKNGEPEVILVPYKKAPKDWFGMDAGKIWMADDFDEWPPDIWKALSDPKIFPDEVDSDE